MCPTKVKRMGQSCMALRGSLLCVFRIPMKGFPVWEALELGVKGVRCAEEAISAGSSGILAG